MPRELYRKLGELGALGIEVPQQYGGGGEDTGFRYLAVVIDEAARAGVTLGTYDVQAVLLIPYLLQLATDEQKARWLPGCVSGDIWTAVAMTEPGTGSDLAGVATTAKATRDGYYLVNGAKTFITGGVHADLVITVCRTSPPSPDDRRTGLSLLCVDTSTPGFAVGRKLEKIGMRASDTAELSFTDVHVPVGDLLGEEGRAFEYLRQNLVRERLAIATSATAVGSAAIDFTLGYVRERKAFGQPIASFQNTKFVLADCAAEIEAAQSLVDRAIARYDQGELSSADAAKAKLFCTETCGRIVDRCLQLHGGYGYVLEYPIARLYADVRVNRIYGGTSEIQKSVIAKDLGL